MTIDWINLHRTRVAIERTEMRLDDLYAQRLAMIRAMVDSGMGQREVGAYWGISNPRVCNMIKKAP